MINPFRPGQFHINGFFFIGRVAEPYQKAVQSVRDDFDDFLECVRELREVFRNSTWREMGAKKRLEFTARAFHNIAAAEAILRLIIGSL